MNIIYRKEEESSGFSSSTPVVHTDPEQWIGVSEWPGKSECSLVYREGIAIKWWMN